ncbi:extracellular solute-binding protein [Auraticoccus sp. F435]|uniref:Extracellular solute-binding protein n=1 Tax=Auraticoccus cholistanensis TaxID=2656650 RepID=A0A6A9UUX8_9ACTN|nr:sugar ABC transporter substrate-binding protein [Auraticoccus cholistanensis]MVA75545.1 extracellular solute-binding protein [Auraticoccus cholistanensis]
MSARPTPRRRRLAAALATLPVLVAASGCGGDQGAGDAQVIDYWLWDSSQQPGYEQCAQAFEAENPGLDVRITQSGWDDYWSRLTAGFIADQAPDVFTNHLTKYPQFVDLQVLLPLDELEATADLDPADYQPGLAELWQGQDGHQYGSPKDWDTVGLFYDRAVLEEAGLSPDDLADLEWNPRDGGTFEQVIAHLSVDANGVRGDEPGFDKENVEVFGLGASGSGGDNFGQTQWSPFTGSLPTWTATETNPWGSEFNFDDPAFQETLEWYYGLAEKGYMPRYDTFGPSSDSYQQFAAGRAALALNGSWMISSFASVEGVELGVAPTPIGPSGQRASMYNGLADSVTRFADDPEAAARWVEFLGGTTCQDIIGESGVVFPATPSGTEKSIQARSEAGIDVSAFTDHIEDETTFLFPVTEHGADITALLQPAMDAVYIGSEPASSLTEVNEQVNRLFDYG